MVMIHAPFGMAAVMLTAAITFAAAPAAGDQRTAAPAIGVTETAGVYRVTATFTVPASPRTAASVLTDYERIPDFMPDVKTSQILERTSSGLVVEQEAEAKFMMFTKRIHLVLDVNEQAGIIRFRDRCGTSFSRYEGAWRLNGNGDTTVVTYELTAKPSFDVPGFVLKRLLKRDAAAMIDRLTVEIARRPPASK